MEKTRAPDEKKNDAVQERLDEMSRLLEIAAKLNSDLKLEEVLDHVYEMFRPLIPFDRLSFALIDEPSRTAWALWVRSEAPLRLEPGYTAALEGSSLMRILETGEPRVLNDLRGYLHDHPESESTRLIVEEGMRSSLTCPMIASGKPVGFLFFSSMKPQTYEGFHSELFLRIAAQLSAAAERCRLYERLVRLSDLKSKLLSVTAHDLRNPMSAIKGYVHFLLETAPQSCSETKDVLQRIMRICDSMLPLLDDLLDLGAVESGGIRVEPRPTDITESLRRAHSLNDILARGKSIDLRLELPPSLPEVMADPGRISQALNNLVSNAVKFSDKGKPVTIKAELASGEVRVSVLDQGPGIAPEVLAEVFAPFTKGPASPTGGERSSGLGLSIAQRMVEAHGRRILTRSAEGQGTTFSFSLPLADSRH